MQDGECFGELVEHPIFARLGGIHNRQLDAAQSIADIQEAAALASLSIHRQRNAGGRLHTESVDGGSENVVIVEAGGEVIVHFRFVRLDSVDHSLMQICGCQFPCPAGEADIVAVVNLRQMVEGPGLAGERQGVRSAFVVDFDEALLNVDVGRAIFPHGAELHDVALQLQLFYGPQQVQGSGNVVDLGEDGPVVVNHGIRSGWLLAIVNNRLRLKGVEHAFDDSIVAQVADKQFQLSPLDRSPHLDPVVKGLNGYQGLGVEFEFPSSFSEVVEHRHFVTGLRQVQRSGPAEITVSAQYQDIHRCPLLADSAAVFSTSDVDIIRSKAQNKL